LFLATTLRRNPDLIQSALRFHRLGLIQPDTYILDLDAICHNGQIIKQTADELGIRLYFMTKQLGRNPLIARAMMEMGYDGAVAVDYKEAETLVQHGIALGNVGHLVQIPSAKVGDVVQRKPNVITIYSVEKAKEVSMAARMSGHVQNIMLRVIGETDVQYPGQFGGFILEELASKAAQIAVLPNLRITGLTSFPCFLFDEAQKALVPTPNIYTIQMAKEILQKNGIEISEINLPSATCSAVLPAIARHGGTHGEPGHGLLGTTPLHAVSDQPEIPAVLYVSEISHTLKFESYCYGGGHYRRSHMTNALIGKTFSTLRWGRAEAPDAESIDYHIQLSCSADIGDTVIMAFRTQIFVTRSDVAVVKGIQSGQPKILGIYDSQGRLLKRGGT
jgi:predicted amino acid racemase